MLFSHQSYSLADFDVPVESLGIVVGMKKIVLTD